MITNILMLATVILAQQPHHPAVTPQVVAAFAYVESSGRVHVKGDGGSAWGLFQFHRDRWWEIGGTDAEYGSASAERQVALMIRALNRYAYAGDRRGIDPIRAMATAHNSGNVRNVETSYTRKIRRCL